MIVTTKPSDLPPYKIMREVFGVANGLLERAFPRKVSRQL
jgi:hypothetical protein